MQLLVGLLAVVVKAKDCFVHLDLQETPLPLDLALLMTSARPALGFYLRNGMTLLKKYESKCLYSGIKKTVNM